jgi:hypothetical protein
VENLRGKRARPHSQRAAHGYVIERVAKTPVIVIFERYEPERL